MQYSVYLTSDLEAALNRYLERHRTSRSRIIQEAIRRFLEGKGETVNDADQRLQRLLRDSRQRKEVPALTAKAKATIRQELEDDTW